MKPRFLLPLLLLTACAQPPFPATAIEDDAEQYSAVVIQDASLAAILHAGRPQVGRIPEGNQLHVVVPLRNIDDEPIQVLAQIEWRAANQELTGDVSNRQVLLIPPGGTVNFVSTSRSAVAEDFVVRVGWNK